MAFENYLIKIGNYTFPMSQIEEKAYSAKVATLDLDSYTDADGVLNRTVIQQIPTVKVKTLPMTDTEWSNIYTGMNNQWNAIGIPEERRCAVTVWVPEWSRYVTQDMYLSDMDITIQTTDGGLKYDSINLSWKGYGVR